MTSSRRLSLATAFAAASFFMTTAAQATRYDDGATPGGDHLSNAEADCMMRSVGIDPATVNVINPEEGEISFMEPKSGKTYIGHLRRSKYWLNNKWLPPVLAAGKVKVFTTRGLVATEIHTDINNADDEITAVAVLYRDGRKPYQLYTDIAAFAAAQFYTEKLFACVEANKYTPPQIVFRLPAAAQKSFGQFSARLSPIQPR